jgi:hypothetical protein
MKAWIGIALSFIFCYLLGLRGWLWLVSGVVMWIPATLLVVAILSLIVRPRVYAPLLPLVENRPLC